MKKTEPNYIWHPITQHYLARKEKLILKGKGASLYDEKNNELIDGFASWYTCVYGHSHDYLIEKIIECLKKYSHVPFVGMTHQPAIDLANILMPILPKNQAKMFFSENGSTAVEVAIKMALQYFYNKGINRKKIIAFHGAFHGDTFGAMSVSDSPIYHEPFNQMGIEVLFIPVPNSETINEVEKQLELVLKTEEIACFIYEPLIQGANCMQMVEARHLDRLLKKVKKYNVLTIADEVMTGFGKTGKNFASEYLEELPDIMCFAKALTAGITPMALTTCTQNIYNAFLDKEISKGFMHAHTYSASPLGCTAAIAGIELLLSDEMIHNRERINKYHHEFMNQIKDNSKVKNIRVLGVILAFELEVKTSKYGAIRNNIYDFFMNKGVFLRPLGNTIYIMPPFIITDKQLNKIYKAIKEVLISDILE